jgi:hypothetical protein
VKLILFKSVTKLLLETTKHVNILKFIYLSYLSALNYQYFLLGDLKLSSAHNGSQTLCTQIYSSWCTSINTYFYFQVLNHILFINCNFVCFKSVSKLKHIFTLFKVYANLRMKIIFSCFYYVYKIFILCESFLFFFVS